MARVTLYTTDYCPFCRAAKALLDRKKVSYTLVDLTDDTEKRQTLEDQTGMRTVPMIFINDKLVGGFQELAELDACGELDPLLSQAG